MKPMSTKNIHARVKNWEGHSAILSREMLYRKLALLADICLPTRSGAADLETKI